MNYIEYFNSPVGRITIASDGESLIGLWFENQKYYKDTLNGEPVVEQSLPVLEETKKWLEIYFSGKNPEFTPKLKIFGSEFRKLVAEIMLGIPYGHVMTYGEIAKEVARRTGKKQMSAQAVGGAVGHNSISLIIPCHRVVGTNGSLTGYAAGINKKQQLLHLEGYTSIEN